MPDALTSAQAALDGQADALAKALKERPEAVRAAIAAAAPAALASLIGQGETEDGGEALRIALQDAQTGPELLGRLGERLDGAKLRGRAGGAGTRLLGARGAALIEQLGPDAGVKPTSASALVDLTAPVLLAALRQAGGTPKDVDGARALLRDQARAVNRALPDAYRPRYEIVLQEEPAGAASAAAGAGRWIALAVLALVIVVAVLWLLLGRAHAQPVATPTFVNAAVNVRALEPFRPIAPQRTVHLCPIESSPSGPASPSCSA